MTSDLLTIRCPKDLLQAIDERVKTEGKRKTDVVIKALRAGLGIEETRQNGSGSASNSNGLYLGGADLDKWLEENGKKYEAKFDEIVARLVQQNDEIVQREVKHAKDEVFELFDILVQQKFDSVQQSVQHSVDGTHTPNLHTIHDVKQNVKHDAKHTVQPELDSVQHAAQQSVQHASDFLQHPQPEVPETVQHDVKLAVQQNETIVKPTVQQNVKQNESQAIQHLGEDVRQSSLSVQQSVKHSPPQDYKNTGKGVQQSEFVVKHTVQQSEGVVDDEAFPFYTTEEREVGRLCEPVEEPLETPDPSFMRLADVAEAEEEHTNASPSTGLETATTSTRTEAIQTMVASEAPQPAPTQKKERKKRSAASDEKTPRPTAEERAKLYPIAPSDQTRLSKRLGVAQGTVSSQKKDGSESFRKWSAEKDPQGIEWEYRDNENPHFHPVLSPASLAAYAAAQRGDTPDV